MDYIVLIFFMVGIVYSVQILTSLFVYKLHMSRLKTFSVEYKNVKYFKIFIILFALYLFLLLLFRISIVSILSGVIVYFAYAYLKKYYKNTIMVKDDYIYNGVALLRIDSVDEVFIEHGSNLEKKYKVRYIGLEKYKSADYIVFKTNKSNYALVKNYDLDYLNKLNSFFTIKAL